MRRLLLALIPTIFLFLLLLPLVPPSSPPSPSVFISPGELRGSSLTHQKIVSTLGFDQQAMLLERLNRASHLTKKPLGQRMTSTEVTKISLHRFSSSDLILKVIGYVDGGLLVVAQGEALYLVPDEKGVREIFVSATE